MAHVAGKAWRYPELQYADAGASIAALVLDCDSPEDFAAGIGDLPPPNWTVWRRSNDHCHVAWTLAKPVHRYPAARQAPLDKLAAIGDAYAPAVGADPGYCDLLAHNPAPHFADDQFSTTWGPERPYTLDELASVIPFGWQLRRPRSGATAICSARACAGPEARSRGAAGGRY